MPDTNEHLVNISQDDTNFRRQPRALCPQSSPPALFLPPAEAGTVTGRDLEHCFPRHGCLRCSLITGLRHFDPSPPAPQYTCTRTGLQPDSACPDPQDSSKSKTEWVGRWVGGVGARCVARPDSSSPSFPTVGPGLLPTQSFSRPSISLSAPG